MPIAHTKTTRSRADVAGNAEGDRSLSYGEFMRTKVARVEATGPDVPDSAIHPALYPFQRPIIRWALRKGRASIWADCGLGKTLMQLEWARLIGGRGLILAPLAVAKQTSAEAKKIGLEVPYCRNAGEITGDISITNYERIDAFDSAEFNWVVLDESSILKGFAGKTRKRLTERFAKTPYRLCCTATPAPNDYLELGNHAEFLGIMTWQEMAAMFFVHDGMSSGNARGNPWRLKGHAEGDFWRWLVSWGVFVRNPADIGFPDDRFNLPELSIRESIVKSNVTPEGYLFGTKMSGVKDRANVRRHTLDARVGAATKLIGKRGEQWIAWVGLNDEGRALEDAIPGSVLVEGADEAEDKAERLLAFARGEYRVLITKPRIAGFGMNFQNCARMVFVGLGDSYEQYYQCIRRCWRYGQTRPVEAHIVVSNLEVDIVANVKRKEQDADKLSREMVSQMGSLEKKELPGGASTDNGHKRDKITDDEWWTLRLGDCVEELDDLDESSIDFSVYSPPFSSLYTYTDSPRDMGNCRGEDAFFDHFHFFTERLLKATKPGRLTACHVSQLAAMASRDGYIGIKDFRGRVIRSFIDAGWIHHGEVVIDKNPQAQAIRTKSKALLFIQLRKDSTCLRPALADFILVFRKPGENAVPVKPDSEVSNEDWIKWAHPVWTDIRETNTLSAIEGRDEKDEKHICPLQLDVIDRLIMLYTNPGELVLSPFAGIGSEGYQSIMRGRRFTGIELKPSYWRAAKRNLSNAVTKAHEGELFGSRGVRS